MANVYCPNCARTVDRSDEECPACGSQLSFTLIESGNETASAMPAGRLDFMPGQTFAGRYTIIERIGSGGMGVVYKAIDTELDTGVALKLIQPALTGMPAFVERFRREVKITRQITHPNICRVHDIGRAGDVLYLSMEWIEGETLQQLLKKAGVLREARALEITEKIAMALEAAHKAGIVHRDLKPANIMVSERGNVRVLDFGLALSDEGGDLTGGGLLLGTPNYMAPEQRNREKLDGRADIYALGLILHEMLTGRRLNKGDESEGDITTVSPLIRPVVDRMTAADREDRYADAGELRHAILELLDRTGIEQASQVTREIPVSRNGAPWWVLGLGSLAVAAVAIFLFWWFTRPSLPPPCANADAELFYEKGMGYLREWSETVASMKNAVGRFNLGLVEDPQCVKLMAGMAEANWLLFRRERSVMWRESAEEWISKGTAIDPDLPELRNAVAVGYIIDGKYEEAVAELEQAIEDRPGLAMAWANLGEAYSYLGEHRKGLEAVRKAVDLNPGSHRMHIYMGLFHQNIGEYAEATGHYVRATEMKPDSWMAWSNLGASYLYRGMFEEAVDALEHTLEQEDSASARTNLGNAHYFLGRYPEAEREYRQATVLEPGRAVYWGNLADAFQVQGKHEDARQALLAAEERAREKVQVEPLSAAARMELAYFCARNGHANCAMDNSSIAVKSRDDDPVLLQKVAVIYCILKRDRECLEWLEKAVAYGASRTQIEAEPEFHRLRDDPTFQELLQRASAG
jgi:tetratricopeptide (TPR) repeat protein